jgi:hypothetical protein
MSFPQVVLALAEASVGVSDMRIATAQSNSTETEAVKRVIKGIPFPGNTIVALFLVRDNVHRYIHYHWNRRGVV